MELKVILPTKGINVVLVGSREGKTMIWKNSS